jgi:PAS domain S-box-containing protein
VKSLVSTTWLQALPTAVYTTDPAGLITDYNDAAAELWGYRPELGKAEWCGAWRLYWPDGRPMAHSECPMAVALRDKAPRSAVEAIGERPDGTRFPFLAYPTPMLDEAGDLVGGVDTLVDIGERKKAEQRSCWLSAIVESSEDAIVSKDLDGIVTSWNTGAENLFGYFAEEIIGKPITIIIPPHLMAEESRIIDHIRRGERIAPYETVRLRRDGTLVDISLSVSPIRDRNGGIVGASKIARDIAELKQARQKQRLLVREMCHRTKNLFALAGGMVSLNARSAATPKQLADSVRERLAALARAHDLTLPDLADDELRYAHKATTLPVLVQTILAPFVATDHGSIEIHGPDVRLEGTAMTSMALFLHEIATNAAKYGALSSPRGRIVASWSMIGDELVLTWQERGGPWIDGPPQNEGFGGQLTKLTVIGQLGGRISYEWPHEGLTVRLAVHPDRLAG